MIVNKPKQIYTQQEYLTVERNAEGKTEFFKGEIFAMGGASRAHNLISGNLFAFLHAFKAKRLPPLFE